MPIELDPILTDVETFLEQSGMNPTSFGVRAVNDPTFVFELRNGRECRRATRERVRTFIGENANASAGQAA